jgi:hypothetical protein
MDDHLARARKQLTAITTSEPDLARVRREARRRRVWASIGVGASAIVLAAGVLAPVLQLYPIGRGSRPAAGSTGSGGTGPTGPEVTGSLTTGAGPAGEDIEVGEYLPPFLAGSEGWFTVASDPAELGEPTFAWAATVPFVMSDLSYGAAIPPETIRALPDDGIVVTVLTVTPEHDPALGPFPYDDLDLDLDRATLRPPEAEESGADQPGDDLSVLELDVEPVLVRVYFGTAFPPASLVEAAQQALDTLQLPPTCPLPGPGGFGVQVDTGEGSPGEIVTISGNVPFQREDGSYDRSREGRTIAWWNAAPGDWPYLSSFSEVEPSAAVPGTPLILLGEAAEVDCTFSISFPVPEAPPGTYPLVVVSEGGGGSALRDSFVIRVIEPA